MAGNTVRHLSNQTAGASSAQGADQHSRSIQPPWQPTLPHSARNDPRTSLYNTSGQSPSNILSPIHLPHTPQPYGSSQARDNYTHEATSSSSSPSYHPYSMSYTHSPASPTRRASVNSGQHLNGPPLPRGIHSQLSNPGLQSPPNHRENPNSVQGWSSQGPTQPITLPVPPTWAAPTRPSGYDPTMLAYTGQPQSPTYSFRTPIKAQSSHECFVGKQGYPQPRPRCGSRTRFSPEDDEVLKWLKEQTKLSWKQIADFFPDRKPGTLQVRYCTKLKDKEQPPWTFDLEDQLTRVVEEVDTDRWKQISHKMGGKFTPEACKEKFSELQEAAQLEQDESTSTQSNPDAMGDE